VAELVRCYEPALLNAVRYRLARSSVRHLLHPQDICQQVWADFFPRMAAGGYQLEQPSHLRSLLQAMARNHLLKQIDRLRTRRRGGVGSPPPVRLAKYGLIDHGDGPLHEVILKELLQKVQNLLSPEERRLAAERAQGWSWAEIAAEHGGTADGLRVRFARAARRVEHRLGLKCERRPTQA
jgi:DNA-directed RNA polymerase specialized sigma24 family protein